jgi:hypothetical protein
MSPPSAQGRFPRGVQLRPWAQSPRGCVGQGFSSRFGSPSQSRRAGCILTQFSPMTTWGGLRRAAGSDLLPTQHMSWERIGLICIQIGLLVVFLLIQQQSHPPLGNNFRGDRRRLPCQHALSPYHVNRLRQPPQMLLNGLPKRGRPKANNTLLRHIQRRETPNYIRPKEHEKSIAHEISRVIQKIPNLWSHAQDPL